MVCLHCLLASFHQSYHRVRDVWTWCIYLYLIHTNTGGERERPGSWPLRKRSAIPTAATDAEDVWVPDLTKWCGATKRVWWECSENCHSELGSLPSYTASGLHLVCDGGRGKTSLLIEVLHQLASPSGKAMGDGAPLRVRCVVLGWREIPPVRVPITLKLFLEQSPILKWQPATSTGTRPLGKRQ